MAHCTFCENFSQKRCPAQQFPTDITHLWGNTPFSQWQTPTQVAEKYGYTTKHILRLIRAYPERIAVRNEDGRYYILTCSFETFLAAR